MTGCTFKQLHSKIKTTYKELTSDETERLLLNIKHRQANLKELSSYLSELESQLALIFAASPDVIVLLDKDAKILKISDAAYSVLEYNRGELIGKCLWDFIALDDLDKTRERFLNLQIRDNEFETNALVNRWISKTGKLVKLVWRFSLFNTEKNYTVGIASDVSVFGNNEKFDVKTLQKAVDLSTDGIIVTDSFSKHNTIVYVNESFCKLTGYDREEFVGKNGKFLQSEECKNSRVITTLRDCIKTGKGCDILLQNVKKNGEVFYNRLMVSAVREGEDVINHIWISKDVTNEIGIKYEWSPNTERGFYFLNE